MAESERIRCTEATCPCPHPECGNHGRCCDCVKGHREGGSLTYCFQLMMEKQQAETK